MNVFKIKSRHHRGKKNFCGKQLALAKITVEFVRIFTLTDFSIQQLLKYGKISVNFNLLTFEVNNNFLKIP